MSSTMQPTGIAIISPSSNIDIDIRFTSATGPQSIEYHFSYLLIEEYGGY